MCTVADSQARINEVECVTVADSLLSSYLICTMSESLILSLHLFKDIFFIVSFIIIFIDHKLNVRSTLTIRWEKVFMNVSIKCLMINTNPFRLLIFNSPVRLPIEFDIFQPGSTTLADSDSLVLTIQCFLADLD